MTINITGPQNYRFQELVAVWIGVLNSNSPQFECYYEVNTGAEDIEIVIENKEIAVQVKGSSGQVGIAQIANWLSHFGNRQSERCLFDRLINGEKVVFVAAGRLSDEAVYFRKKSASLSLPIRESLLSAKTVELLLQKFSNVDIPGEREQKLYKDRAAHCRKFCQLDVGSVQQHLKNLAIFEEITIQEIIKSLREHLAANYYIADEKCEQVIQELVTSVRDFAGKEESYIPGLIETIRKYSQNELKPKEYVERHIEAQIREVLIESNLVLLSGEPRCGKSQTALVLADDLMKQGYKFATDHSVDEAIKFLQSPDGTKRIFILEDPFGSRGLVNGDLSIHTKLQRLLKLTNSNRKLVVCQSQDELTHALGVATLDQARISGKKWYDLGNYESGLLLEIWRKLTKRESVPKKISEIVEEMLTQGTILEPGALEYLAYNYDLHEGKIDTESIARFARREAFSLGSHMIEKFGGKMEDLLGVLSICTFGSKAIHEGELIHVLNQTAGLVGRSNSIGIEYSFGRDEYPDFPKYDALTLDNEYRSNLDTLVRRGILRENERSYHFRHMYYRAAAEITIERLSSRFLNNLSGFLRRAIFSLDPKVSVYSIRNIEWLLCKVNSRFQREIIEILFDGQKSIFPATKEACFTLLHKISDLLNEKDRLALNRNSKYIHSNFSALSWNGNTPWLSGFGTFNIFSRKGTINSEFAKVISDRIGESGVDSCTTKEVIDLVEYFVANPKELKVDLAISLFNSDISTIRSAIAEVWIKEERTDDDVLLSLIFEDSIPFVVLKVFDAVRMGWRNFNEARRSKLEGLLLSAINRNNSSHLLMDHLVVFDRDELEGTDWSLFEKVFPAAFKRVGIDGFYSDVRFHGVLTEAKDYISPDAMFSICRIWCNAIVGTNKVLSDYTLGVTDFLFLDSFSSKFLEERDALCLGMLGIVNVPNRLAIISGLVSNWRSLSWDLKNALLELAGGSGGQGTWIKATMITRTDVPSEIQLAVLGRVDGLEDLENTSLSSLDLDLLSACIAIYVGEPDPIHYVGIGHRSKYWKRVYENILADPSHPIFEFAFERLIYGEESDFILEVVKRALNSKIDFLVKAMFNQRLSCTGWLMPNVWRLIVLQLEKQNKMDMFFEFFEKLAPALVESADEFFSWLVDGKVADQALRKFPAEYATMRQVLEIFKLHDLSSGVSVSERNRLEVKVADLTRAMLVDLNRAKLKIFWVYDIVESALNIQSFSDAGVFENIKIWRGEALDERESTREKYRYSVASITNWDIVSIESRNALQT
ncbi:hypothetical protein [Bdellovibrio sp.]|uniref:nSTAND3 domain-containing NTPase n=1 Tax=Bdellovibrio sp. TaxID=28201 RepID=UPI003221BACB